MEIAVRQAHEIDAIAGRHGFKRSGFRSFEQPVTEAQITRVQERALTNRGG